MDAKLEEIKARNKLALEGDHSHIEQLIGIHESTYKNLCASQNDVSVLISEVERLSGKQEILKRIEAQEHQQIATLKKALAELIQTGKYNFCELCGAQCVDAGLDFVEEMSQCGCFVWHEIQQAQEQEGKK